MSVCRCRWSVVYAMSVRARSAVNSPADRRQRPAVAPAAAAAAAAAARTKAAKHCCLDVAESLDQRSRRLPPPFTTRRCNARARARAHVDAAPRRLVARRAQTQSQTESAVVPTRSRCASPSSSIRQPTNRSTKRPIGRVTDPSRVAITYDIDAPSHRRSLGGARVAQPRRTRPTAATTRRRSATCCAHARRPTARAITRRQTAARRHG